MRMQQQQQQQKKRQAKVWWGGVGFLLFGVFFHAVSMYSIFDIYFKSPIVEHTSTTISSPSFSPPAKRLVFFVADGCRADKFFQLQNHPDKSRTPFLRDVIRTKGSWGVSHTKVPTESRPGHVAMFAGMYEDVSAVTKGWQENPIQFDSIFNQSSSSWLFGSPDIVPMFAKNVPHAHETHYSHEEEDFAKDASSLDVWVYEKLKAFLLRAAKSPSLLQKLRSSKVIFFCHLLGIDSNGHAHRPNSKEYLDNIALVDELVKKIHDLIEDFYDHDGQTSFIFSADHGMSNKGAHGDGDPSNTRTPLVAWGAGISPPIPVEKQIKARQSSPGPKKRSRFRQLDLPTQSKKQILDQWNEIEEENADSTWGLENLMRKDVMQADIAALASSVIGLPFPRHSVGILPFSYLIQNEYRMESILLNVKQLHSHARLKSNLQRSRSVFFFQPFQPLEHIQTVILPQLESLYQSSTSLHEFERLSQSALADLTAALKYFHQYNWPFLMTVVSLGYFSWIGVLIAISCSSSQLRLNIVDLIFTEDGLNKKTIVALTIGGIYLWLHSSPFSYYLYGSFPVVFIGFLASTNQLQYSWNQKGSTQLAVIILLSLEMVVFGYKFRQMFSVLFVTISLWAWYHFGNIAVKWSISCLVLSLFPLLPTEYGDDMLLVYMGAVGSLLLFFWFASQSGDDKPHFLSFLLIGLSMALVYVTVTIYLQQKVKPPFHLPLLCWFVSIGSLLTPALASPKPFPRFTSIMMALAPFYILLSISYEVLFYSALCFSLHSWVHLEVKINRKSEESITNDARIAFFFLIFIQIAFFGTGNVASMSSFEISSTYRFVTVFSPFLMGALLIFKILIPFTLVICSLQIVTGILNKNRYRLFLLFLAMSDLLAVNFFFLVKDEGSWKEIGNSISYFGIVNAQVIFIPLMFLLSRAYLRQIHYDTTTRHKIE